MLLRHIPLPHSLCDALTRWSHMLYAGGEGLGEEVTLHRSVYSVHFTTKQFYPEQCHHGNDNVNIQKQPRWITTQGGGNCPCNVMMSNKTLQPLRKGCEDFFAITSTVIHRLFHIRINYTEREEGHSPTFPRTICFKSTWGAVVFKVATLKGPPVQV